MPVKLDGSLTVPFCDEILSRVAEAFEANDAVTIDVAGASEVDVSFLQILVAASKTAAQTGKTLVIETAGLPLLAHAAARCGLPLTTTPHGVAALPTFSNGSL